MKLNPSNQQLIQPKKSSPRPVAPSDGTGACPVAPADGTGVAPGDLSASGGFIRLWRIVLG